ncbi:unnamed protein product [Closterium sp. NIES-54]
MIRLLPLADPSPLPSPSPSACLLWLPVPAPLRAPGFRPPFCPLGDFLLIRGAPPSALPTLPPVPIVASAACAPFAPPPYPSRAAAAFLATVTRRLPSCCAAGGVQVSAPPLRTPPSARGASRVSGSRPCPAMLTDSAIPGRASCCCAPLAADRAAPMTHAPPCASLAGALVAWVSVAHPSIRHRAPAAVPANACRCRVRDRSAPSLPCGLGACASRAPSSGAPRSCLLEPYARCSSLRLPSRPRDSCSVILDSSIIA